MKNKLLIVLVIFGLLISFVANTQALQVSREISDLTTYIQTLIFTSNGSPTGTSNIRISGVGGNTGKGVLYMSGDLWVGKGSTNAIFANSNNGNVGIGTGSGLNRLEVNGDIRGSANLYVANKLGVGTATPNKNLHILDTVNNAEIDLQSKNPGTNQYYALYHDKGSDQFRIRGYGGDRFKLEENGNLGLSTTGDPTARLDVDGDIKIGNTADACNASNVGKVKSASNYMRFCNGTAWTPLNMPNCQEGEYLQFKSGAWTCLAARQTATACGGTIVANGISNATATSRTQTWNLLAWEPVNNRHYSTTQGVCTYVCNANYNWNGSACVAATRSASCGGGIPGSAYATTAGTYTQTWNGSSWAPVYNRTYGAGVCGFACGGGTTWNGSSCVQKYVRSRSSECSGTRCQLGTSCDTGWQRVSGFDGGRRCRATTSGGSSACRCHRDDGTTPSGPNCFNGTCQTN